MFDESSKTKRRSFNTASLFCGAGGLDLGFSQAGFTTLWANDLNADACETYRSWSEATVICGDISKINISEIPDTDIILGGFPCQGFSLSGPRKIDDSRNRLYKEYVRVVRAKRPAVFIGENVKGLLTMAGGAFINAIIADFADCGYDIYYQIINAKNYGVPQDRERVIIVGFRKDLHISSFVLPKYIGEPITLASALAGIITYPEDICYAPFSPRYMSRNRKRNWNQVSYTIPAMAKQVALHPDSPDMVKLDQDLWRFGNDGETRRLSWRECAAIQTFPSDIYFTGDLSSKYRQIGNAVPVNLGKFIADAVYPILEGKL